MTQLTRPSVVVNAAAIYVKSEFRDGGSTPAFGKTLGGTGGNAGGFTALPALYVAVPFTERLVGGVGVNAPFGLKTEYDDDWMGRFQAIKSEVKTTNINTALAFKVHDKVSIGIGADFQTIDATLTNYVWLGAPTQAQALATVEGDDSAWGYDVGVLLTPTENTHVGFSYRSAIKYSLTGQATFAAPAPSTLNGPISLDLKLPASARLAVAQKLSSSVELLGEVSWTQWSSIQDLNIVRTSGAMLKTTPENWDNSMRYALGASWQVNNSVKLRAGAAFDETMVTDTATRTPRLPDGDRTWLAVGAKLNVTNKVAVDMGYMHVFVKDADLNQTDGNSAIYGLLRGQQQTKIDILGVQATVSF